MKILIATLLALATLSTFGQNSKTVDLKWKIGKNEKLNYSTVMNVIDTSTFEMNLGGLLKALSDSSKSSLTESEELFNKLNDAFKNQDHVTTTTLTNKDNGVINIVTETKPKETPSVTTGNNSHSNDSNFLRHLKEMQSLNEGVMLRGSVYETGGIQSFWVKTGQKNLIALLFELPTKPVKIGDKWPLDVNFIENDQNFDCDSSFKINEVTLVDIKKVNGATVAVLKYNIVEYVKGIFNSPFSASSIEQTETMMKFSYQGLSEFSVDKGRWLSYNGILSVETTGFATTDTKTKLTLTDEKDASR